MKRPALLAAIASVATASAVAATLPRGFDDNPSVIDAVAKAQISGKPVVVYFAESHCEVCTALDGWLVRSDVRQAYKDAYHFAVVFGDDMVPEERQRWNATYAPRGAPAWVVLASDGSYLCTASGGFANAGEALDLHKRLTRAVSSRGGASATKVSDAPDRHRPCTDRALGLAHSAT